MDHPPGVGVGDRLGDRLEDRQEPGPIVVGAVAGLEQLGQGVALDQLHGEEGPAVGEGAQLVDGDDAGVLELAADLRLLDEPSDHVRIIAEVVAEDLQSHVASEVGVAALEDGAHAAAGDLAVDAIADRGIVVAVSLRPDDRPGLLAGGRVAEQDAGDGADGCGDRVQDAGGGRLAAGPSGRSRAAGPGTVDAQADQAAGADPRGTLGATFGAAVGLGHGSDSEFWRRSSGLREDKASEVRRYRGPGRIFRDSSPIAAARPPHPGPLPVGARASAVPAARVVTLGEGHHRPLLPVGEKVPEGRMRGGPRRRGPLTPALSPLGRGRALSPGAMPIPPGEGIHRPLLPVGEKVPEGRMRGRATAARPPHPGPLPVGARASAFTWRHAFTTGRRLHYPRTPKRSVETERDARARRTGWAIKRSLSLEP